VAGLAGLALVVVVAAVGACSRESEVRVRPTDPRPPMRPSPTIAEAGTFPVTVDGPDGPVTVARRPERIVSLSASATEALAAIEAGDQVVGLEATPAAATGASAAGLRAAGRSREAVERLRPDLVVAEDDGLPGPPAALAGVAQRGVPVLEVVVPDTLEASYAAIEMLGRATGHPRRSGEVVEDMRREIAALAARAATRPGRGMIYHELDDRLHTVTSLSLVGRIYQQLGFANAGDRVESGEGYRYGQLSDEKVAALDPAWIVLAHDPACDLVAALAARGWGGLQAVRSGRVGVVDGELARTWGPRVVDLVREILMVTGLIERPRGRPHPDGRAATRPACPRRDAPPLPLPDRPAAPSVRARPPALAHARSEPRTGPGSSPSAAERRRGQAGTSPASPAPAPAGASLPTTTTTPVPAAPLTPQPAAMAIEPLAAGPGVAPVITRIETDDPVVFLTIDDGTVRFPGAQAAFRELGIPATWFLIDEPITAEPEFFRPLLGTSVVESHSRSHPDMRGLTEARQRREICANADSAAQAFGRRPVLFRPPYGLYNADTQRAAAACGMRAVVLWEQNVNHDMVGFRRRPGFRPGDIILMHLRPQFVQELHVIRQRVEAAGLRFALLEDYLAPDTVPPGVQR
jgi:iron complex transport system substrate-binding protein